MRIIITGAGGFLGQMLARALIARGGLADEPGAAPRLTELVLLDREFPPDRIENGSIDYEQVDVGDATLLARAYAPGADVVFHLAAVVSAGAEADFDLGMEVN